MGPTKSRVEISQCDCVVATPSDFQATTVVLACGDINTALFTRPSDHLSSVAISLCLHFKRCRVALVTTITIIITIIIVIIIIIIITAASVTTNFQFNAVGIAMRFQLHRDAADTSRRAKHALWSLRHEVAEHHSLNLPHYHLLCRRRGTIRSACGCGCCSSRRRRGRKGEHLGLGVDHLLAKVAVEVEDCRRLCETPAFCLSVSLRLSRACLGKPSSIFHIGREF
eukprot:COSAG06_NODE_2131_length_7528_cov_29.514470_4_plen_226_part_00